MNSSKLFNLKFKWRHIMSEFFFVRIG